MRNELEMIQKIEQFLSGQLSAADTALFEQKLLIDDELKTEVELQQQILKGLERSAIKATAVKASQKYKQIHNLYNWSIGGISFVVIGLAIAYAFNMSNNNKFKHEPVVLKVDSLTLRDTLTKSNLDSLETKRHFTNNTLNEIHNLNSETTNSIVSVSNFENKDISDSLLKSQKENQGANIKVYRLNISTPSYTDSIEKARESIKKENYSDFFQTMRNALNLKKIIKTTVTNENINDSTNILYKDSTIKNIQKKWSNTKEKIYILNVKQKQ